MVFRIGDGSMSDKNLLIGDTTYPHTPSTFPTELIDQLRFCANALETEYGYNIFSIAIAKSIDRIEQLERELDQEKTDCTEALLEFATAQSRYEYVRKLNAHQFQEIFMRNLAGSGHFDDVIDAAIKESK
jgi:hypothetical protein